MGRAWVIAKNTVLEIRQRRIAYLVAVLLLLTALSASVSLSMLARAEQAGELELASRMPRMMITGMIGFWDGAITLVALFLGATVLSAEVKSRAIIPTLARPVSRGEFLVGKALGVTLVALALFAIPFCLSLLAAWWFEVDLTSTFWLGLAQGLSDYVTIAIMTVALAAVTSPVTAGLLVFVVLPVARELGGVLAKAEHSLSAALGLLLYFLAPASPPHDLMEHSFSSTLLDPAHGLTMLVMLENLGYAVVLFALAAWAFERQEIRGDG